ncbi:MAG: cupin domain-containing protein [Acidobacteriia bacterium]|nr:cupin domain-containing protein [Terriglobia bacterium]MBV8902176.1 cupin domain-containing protein [Terriglobia bacterium]
MRTEFPRHGWWRILPASLIAAAPLLWFGILDSPRTAKAQQKQNSVFTGTVTPVTENSQASIAHFRFEAGARTKWHSHEAGQIILAEDGVCRVQAKGGPAIELHAGQAIYSPPGEVHWHGAAPDEACTQFNVTRAGKMNVMEEVVEKDYTAAAAKK